MSLAQRNMDPALAQALLAKGVIHCLPFLAKLTQYQCKHSLVIISVYCTLFVVDDNIKISDLDLLEAGVTSTIDRMNILDAFQVYEKEKLLFCDNYAPSAPVVCEEEASAPLPNDFKTITTAECVICLDVEVRLDLDLCYVIYYKVLNQLES